MVTKSQTFRRNLHAQALAAMLPPTDPRVEPQRITVVLTPAVETQLAEVVAALRRLGHDRVPITRSAAVRYGIAVLHREMRDLGLCDGSLQSLMTPDVEPGESAPEEGQADV